MGNIIVRRGRLLLLLAGGIVAGALAGGSPASAAASAGAVFTQDNDPAGNAVQMFERAADGALAPGRSFPTGGVGLATLGGRQGAVALSDDEGYLYAVNAGSNTVTTFRVTGNGLENLGAIASHGVV